MQRDTDKSQEMSWSDSTGSTPSLFHSEKRLEASDCVLTVENAGIPRDENHAVSSTSTHSRRGLFLMCVSLFAMFIGLLLIRVGLFLIPGGPTREKGMRGEQLIRAVICDELESRQKDAIHRVVDYLQDKALTLV